MGTGEPEQRGEPPDQQARAEHKAKLDAFLAKASALSGLVSGLFGVVGFQYNRLGGSILIAICAGIGIYGVIHFWQEVQEAVRHFLQKAQELTRRSRKNIGYFILGAVVAACALLLWKPWRTEAPAPGGENSKVSVAGLTVEPSPCPEVECPECPVCPVVEGTELVYRTRTGNRYHRATCGSVVGRPGVTALTIEQARAAGLTSCANCNPPP